MLARLWHDLASESSPRRQGVRRTCLLRPPSQTLRVCGQGAAHSIKPFSHARASSSDVNVLVDVAGLFSVMKKLAMILLRGDSTSRANALTRCMDSGLPWYWRTS